MALLLICLLLLLNSLCVVAQVVQQSAEVRLRFAPVLTDNAVLQRAPAAASVYGVVEGTRSPSSRTPQISITVTKDNDPTGSSAYTIAAQHVEVVNATYARWRATLRPGLVSAGAHTIAATLATSDAAAAAGAKISNILFGEVWLCSGQSNAWLPMHFSLSRNSSYDALIRGKSGTLRLITLDQAIATDVEIARGDFDPSLGAMQNTYAADAWQYPGGGWQRAQVGTYPDGAFDAGGHFFNNTVAAFSALCYYYGEKISEQWNHTVPIGLISSSWGGTTVEDWSPNASLTSGVCSYPVGGGASSPSSSAVFSTNYGNPIASPATLYNAMILPLANMTIKGVVWYQGENNVFQCRTDLPPGDPTACGDSLKVGYGCFIREMLQSWRRAFRDPNLPFGVVSLAGSTSEGHSNAIASFRNAQTAGGGVLPNDRLGPTSFVAQAFDVGEPAGGDESDGNSCEFHHDTEATGFACKPGFGSFTPFFMGGIHPRAKRIVARRLGQAARAVVYADKRSKANGPVLVSCSLRPADPSEPVDPKHALPISGPRLVLTFNVSMLGEEDAVAVRVGGWELALPHGPPDSMTPYPMSLGARGQPFADLIAAGLLSNRSGMELLQILTQTWRPGAPGNAHNLLYTSPLEVRYGGDRSNLSDTNGVWLSARLFNKCYDRNSDGSHGCGFNTTTGKRLKEWNMVVAALPLGALNASEITAIRYGWSEDGCCPGAVRTLSPCPPASCPISARGSTLPAVPFLARVNAAGVCDWSSLGGPGGTAVKINSK